MRILKTYKFLAGARRFAFATWPKANINEKLTNLYDRFTLLAIVGYPQSFNEFYEFDSATLSLLKTVKMR